MIQILMLLACIYTSVQANGADYSPAMFGQAENDLRAKIKISDIEFLDEIVVQCGGRLSKRGRFANIVCTEHDSYPKLERRVRRAARYLRLTPATVAGETIRVWFSFSVVFSPSELGLEVQVFNNHLWNRTELGSNYISAQRYDYSLGWAGGCTMPPTGILAAAKIDESGNVMQVKTSSDGAFVSCIKNIVKNVEGSKFIPAHLDGEPVASRYIELFW